MIFSRMDGTGKRVASIGAVVGILEDVAVLEDACCPSRLRSRLRSCLPAALSMCRCRA